MGWGFGLVVFLAVRQRRCVPSASEAWRVLAFGFELGSDQHSGGAVDSRWKRVGVATVVLVLSAATLLVVPSAASAQTYRHRDATRDVRKVIDSDVNQPAPANSAIDITAVAYTHTSEQVTTKIWLRGHAGRQWWWAEGIATPARGYTISGTKLPGEPIHLKISREGRHSDRFRCAGLSARIRPADGIISVSVPARCLNAPRWVRIGLFYWRPCKKIPGFVDDPLYKGVYDTAGWEPVETPRLYRR